MPEIINGEINKDWEQSAQLAKEYATKAEDSEVESGEYSALHHAAKASASALAAADSATAAAASAASISTEIMEKTTYDTDNDGVVDNAEKAAKINNIETAGNLKFYGTDSSGTPGFQDFQSNSEMFKDTSKKVVALPSNDGSPTYFSIYVMADGSIKAVGHSSSSYRNGDPNNYNTYLPIRVATNFPVKFSQVISGIGSSYGITIDQDVYSWGLNNYGQLCHNNTIDTPVATRIDYFYQNNIKIEKIETTIADYYDYPTTIFLTTNGKVYSAGFNSNGSLGIGTIGNHASEPQETVLSNITYIAISSYPSNCAAISWSEDLFVWGWNGDGGLGLGHTNVVSNPTLAKQNVSKIHLNSGYNTAGADPRSCSIIIDNSGKVYTTGYNDYGQLGHGDTTQRTFFTQISALNDETITDITGSNDRYPSFAMITSQKEIYFTGCNGYGQHGSGDTAHHYIPYKPSGDFQGHVLKVKFGGGRSYIGTFILTDENELWAAGYGNYGQMGIGTYLATNHTFQRVYQKYGGIIKDFWCEGYASGWGLRLLYEDGTVDACGYNGYGGLGTQSANLHSSSLLSQVYF